MFFIFLSFLVFSVVSSVDAIPRRLKPQCRSNVCDDRPECPLTSCRCLFASKMDCAVYYQCVNGKPIQYRCSSGLMFNNETLTCDYSHNVNCSFTADATTSIAVTNVTSTMHPTTTETLTELFTTKMTEKESTTNAEVSETTSTAVTTKSPTPEEPTTTVNATGISSTIISTSDSITSEETEITTAELTTSEFDSSTGTTFNVPKTTETITASTVTETVEESTSESFTSETEKLTTTIATSKVPTFTTSVTEITTQEEEETSTTEETMKPTDITTTKSTTEEETPTELITSSFSETFSTAASTITNEVLITNSTVTSTDIETTASTVFPSSEFTCPSRFGLFADPKSCLRFYHCSHWKAFHKWCPSNLHFNPKLRVCDWPSSAGCDSAIPTAIKPDNIPSDVNSNNTIGTCDCDCCEVPVPGECKAYVLCINKVAYKMSCGKDLYFNPMTSTCDFRDKVDCIEDNIKCVNSSGRFLLEGSCSYFMECHNYKKTVKKCPEGLQFNQSSEMCSWLGTCSGRPSGLPTSKIITNNAICGGCDYCFKPIMTDCSRYVKCSQNVATEERCAPGLVFNSVTEMCDHDYNVQCPNPQPQLECPDRFGYFPYPEECGMYIYCVNGSANVKSCAGILHFDPIKKHCDYPWAAGCSNSDARPTPNPNQNLTECDCDCCLKPTGSDCRSFILCINQVGFVGSCSSGLRFNPETENCDFAENVDCPLSPEISGLSCPEHQGLFPHPDDCTKFIHCAHGFPYVKDCPSKLHFNPTLKVCDWPYSAGCQGLPVTEPPTKNKELPCDVCDSCFVPDVSDCASYIYCRNGTGYRLRCTEDLLFNPEKETCDLASNVKCPSQPPSQCPKADGLFPAKQCSQFIHCSNGIAYLKDCPDGLQFNAQILVCDWPENVKCGEEPVQPTFPPSDDSENNVKNDSCNCDCCFLPHPNDCSKYILCLDGYQHIGQCSRGLLFDPSIQNCVKAERVTCGELSPLCPEPNGLFPNPNNCESYYKCSSGISETEYCQNGMHFSAERKQCLDPCKAECDNSYECSTRPETITSNPVSNICVEPDGFYPKKNDCTSFYVCSNGQPQLVRCPNGLHYNSYYEACEEPCLAKCDLNINCDRTTKSFSSSTSTPSITSTTTLSPYCIEKEGLFQNIKNCSTFYRCSNGIAHLISCPPGLHFSDEHKVCKYPCAAKCNSTIDCNPTSTSVFSSTSTTSITSTTTLSPYCIENEGLFQNKKNCSTFYQCSNGEAHLVSCPPGLHFSDEHKACEYPCAAKCNSTIDCDTTSTSFSTSASTPFITSTTLSPNCIEKDGLFQNKRNCSTFYQCSNGKEHLVSCPPGLHFSDEHKACEYPCAAKCNSTIDCDTTSTGVPSTTSTPSIVSTTTLSPECVEKDGLFPNKRNCSTFYECSNGRAHLVSCPPGLHFSDEHKACEYPCAAKCNSTIDCDTTSTSFSTSASTPFITSTTLSPNCIEKDGLFQNKRNCSTFYQCSNGKEHLVSCPPGLHFSDEHEACEYPCAAKCNSTIDCDTTSTSVPSTTSTPSIVSATTLSPECVEKDGLFPNKRNCSTFYQCSNGRAHLVSCPPDLHFSDDHRVCEYPCAAKCNLTIDCSPTTPKTESSTPSVNCPNSDGLYPVEDNCTSFYYCSDGTKYLIYCPSGLHFSRQHQICEDPCLARCNTSIDCKTTTQPISTTYPPLSPECKDPNGLFSNPNDCGSFYQCSNGRSHLIYCPNGLHFSVVDLACERPCAAGCNTSIDCSTTTEAVTSTDSPNCPTPDGLHSVPHDCTTFYLCSSGKEYLIPCPPGQHFSKQHEICEDPCLAQCNTTFECGTSAKPVSSTLTPMSKECEEPDGLFPNPDDCGSFYQCSNGRSHLIQCPSGLHFSIEDSACERPCVAGCNISTECPPEVPDNKGNCSCENCYLPDPNDCSAFYHCENGHLTKNYCPFGTLFSKISNICEDESVVDCEAVGDPSMCPEAYGFFPYPGDCRKFVHCENRVAHVKECPEDLEYDPLNRVCTKPKGYCGEIVLDPKCPEPTGIFPDLNDCSVFYHCEHGVAYPKKCSAPLLFNPEEEVCDWPDNVNCGKENSTSSTSAPTTVSKTTTIKFSTLSEASSSSTTVSSAECHEVPGVICPCACRVPTYDECSSFFQCRDDGTACKKFCPEGLFFNQREMVCDLPENVQCRDFFFTTIRRAKLYSHRLRS